MLSYQHAYHAGNLADVHKHSLLAWILSYMTKKDKPLSYMETHAGRGLYHLDSSQALKTGEAKKGIQKAGHWFEEGHPYKAVIDHIAKKYGQAAYPGSPYIAGHILRGCDKIILAELHPQEYQALKSNMKIANAQCVHKSGWDLLKEKCPPTPRRGMLLVDPSYEVKSDYTLIPQALKSVHSKWPVGVLALWYPILKSQLHTFMIRELKDVFPNSCSSEVHFPAAQKNHGMVGSGLWTFNAPYGFEVQVKWVEAQFLALR